MLQIAWPMQRLLTGQREHAQLDPTCCWVRRLSDLRISSIRDSGAVCSLVLPEAVNMFITILSSCKIMVPSRFHGMIYALAAITRDWIGFNTGPAPEKRQQHGKLLRYVLFPGHRYFTVSERHQPLFPV